MSYMGHVLTENRNGLVAGAILTQTIGTAEREAAPALVDALKSRWRFTLAADKAYEVRAFISDLRARKVTPHVTRDDCPTKTGKRCSSAINRRTTRHPGYAVSLRIRKRIEKVFSWVKTIRTLRKTCHKGTDRVGWAFTLAAPYNLIRMLRLLAVT